MPELTVSHPLGEIRACAKCHNPQQLEVEREGDMTVNVWHCRMCGRTEYQNAGLPAAIAWLEAHRVMMAEAHGGGRPRGPLYGVDPRKLPCQCGTGRNCRRHKYGKGDPRQSRYATGDGD